MTQSYRDSRGRRYIWWLQRRLTLDVVGERWEGCVPPVGNVGLMTRRVGADPHGIRRFRAKRFSKWVSHGLDVAGAEVS